MMLAKCSATCACSIVNLFYPVSLPGRALVKFLSIPPLISVFIQQSSFFGRFNILFAFLLNT
jgi:hypothetical protein